MKTCLVTGASGFVGFNLAMRLLGDGHAVHVLLRTEHQPWRITEIADHVRIHTVDMLDEEKLRQAVQAVAPDWIFHLAAYGAYSWQKDVNRILLTNVVGTSNMIQACLETGFQAFVNAGSSSEYGLTETAPSEQAKLDPNSHYAVAKAAAAHLCRYASISEGRRIITLRLYSVYGPYEDPHRLLPAVIIRGLNNGLPTLVSPDVARDFVYIDDVVDAFLLVASSEAQGPGEIYNVGTGTQITIREVVATAKQAMSIDVEPAWNSMENRIWDTETWVCDNSHIRDILGWSPKFDFLTGFQRMVDWFKENPRMRRYYEAQYSQD
jgi:nucleoside-diphosphate-sugar epimerase